MKNNCSEECHFLFHCFPWHFLDCSHSIASIVRAWNPRHFAQFNVCTPETSKMHFRMGWTFAKWWVVAFQVEAAREAFGGALYSTHPANQTYEQPGRLPQTRNFMPAQNWKCCNFARWGVEGRWSIGEAVDRVVAFKCWRDNCPNEWNPTPWMFTTSAAMVIKKNYPLALGKNCWVVCSRYFRTKMFPL